MQRRHISDLDFLKEPKYVISFLYVFSSITPQNVNYNILVIEKVGSRMDVMLK